MNLNKAEQILEDNDRNGEIDDIVIVEYIDKDNYKDYIGKTINVEGDVNLNGFKLEKLPLKFNKVGGDFWCGYNDLTTLEGCPKSVGKSFWCMGNRLTSLEGCPESVGGDFYCWFNKLSSLKGCAKLIGGDFDCSYNDLTSLEGCPKSVGRYFDSSHNKLTSLDNCPEHVGGSFYCRDNKVRFTEEEVKELCIINGNIKCD